MDADDDDEDNDDGDDVDDDDDDDDDEVNADDDLYFAKGGAPDYQLVYFFWEKGKVETKERKTSFLCKTLKNPFSDKIGGKLNLK